MNLGIFLSPGDSLTRQLHTGQYERLLAYYLRPYSRRFKKVFIFSYGDRKFSEALPENVFVISKPALIPNSIYQLVMPLLWVKTIKVIDVFRVFQAPGGIPAIISKLLFKKPYLVTYGYDYAAFAKIDSRLLLTALLNIIVPVVLRLASKVIVTDPKNLSFKHSVLIANGVDPDLFRLGASREPGLVLSVGRLVPQKNYSKLIRVVSLSQKGSRIKLVIVGEGQEKNRLISLAERLGVSLILIPSVSHSKLIGWYQRATVFALTSKIEGQPKVLLEAMSCGCACLTTFFSGNVIRNKVNGLVVSGNRQLALSLDKLMSQSDFNRQLGTEARKTIIKSYNVKQLVAKEIELLTKC